MASRCRPRHRHPDVGGAQTGRQRRQPPDLGAQFIDKVWNGKPNQAPASPASYAAGFVNGLERERFTMDEDLSARSKSLFPTKWTDLSRQTTVAGIGTENGGLGPRSRSEENGHLVLRSAGGWKRISGCGDMTRRAGRHRCSGCPEDERYTDFIGKTIKLPLVDRETRSSLMTMLIRNSGRAV